MTLGAGGGFAYLVNQWWRHLRTTPYFHLLFRIFFLLLCDFPQFLLLIEKLPSFLRNQKRNTSKKYQIRKTESGVLAGSGSFIGITCGCYNCLGQLSFSHFIVVFRSDLPFDREKDPKVIHGLENYIYIEITNFFFACVTFEGVLICLQYSGGVLLPPLHSSERVVIQLRVAWKGFSARLLESKALILRCCCCQTFTIHLSYIKDLVICPRRFY